MDLDYFLNERLNFVDCFYTHTVAAFEEIKRKIDAQEPPYVDTSDPEDAYEPPFFAEWQNAEGAMNITGAACLDVLQASLHEFLNRYMHEIGQEHLVPRLKEMGKSGWFGNYRAFFEKLLQIDWASSGADLGLLEQVILTRNDFTHNVDLLSVNAFQIQTHAKNFPNSAFTDPEETPLSKGKRLVVSAEALRLAILAARVLGEYLSVNDGSFLNAGGQNLCFPETCTRVNR